MDLEKVCRQISKELPEDYDTVKNVVMHQFKFIVEVMKDEKDTHDILINQLFKFKLKSRFKNDKQANYTPK